MNVENSKSYIHAIRSGERNVKDVITDALTDPDLFYFLELLEEENVKILKQGSEDEWVLYELLEVFSYGDLQQLIALQKKHKLDFLSDDILKKINLITLCDLASHKQKVKCDSAFRALNLAENCNSRFILGKLLMEGNAKHLFEAVLDWENGVIYFNKINRVPEWRDEDREVCLKMLENWAENISQAIEKVRE